MAGGGGGATVEPSGMFRDTVVVVPPPAMSFRRRMMQAMLKNVASITAKGMMTDDPVINLANLLLVLPVKLYDYTKTKLSYIMIKFQKMLKKVENR